MTRLALALLLVTLIHQVCFLFQVEAGDGFIRTRGVHFLLNGSPYYANGFNAYWLMYTASDPSQRSKVSAAFREAASHGLTVARTWAFSDGGYSPLQYSPGSYNEQMFKVLESLFFLALPVLINLRKSRSCLVILIFICFSFDNL